MSLFSRIIPKVNRATRSLGLGPITVRAISGPGGLDKHFAPYPALPKVTPMEAPVSAPSTQSSSIFSNLTAQHLKSYPTPAERWVSVHEVATREMREPGNVYTGRSIPISERADMSIAYRRLHTILARNRVRSELFLQRRYEKPSDRVRRLKSERHRRRFAAWVSPSIADEQIIY